MLCYHGVPMMSPDGELGGTLCHFDLVPRDIEDAGFGLLMQAGRVLPDCMTAWQHATPANTF